jgi:hypothetical protein
MIPNSRAGNPGKNDSWIILVVSAAVIGGLVHAFIAVE